MGPQSSPEPNLPLAPEGVSPSPKASRHRRRLVVFSTLVLLAIALLSTGVGYVWHEHSNGVRRATSSSNKSSTHPGTVTGWVHTDGTSLVDSAGNRIILAGVDDSSLDAGQGNTPDRCHLMWSPASATEIDTMHTMGFNMVRIGVSWANLEPTAPTVGADGLIIHHWNTQYLAALDNEIAALQANHIMAILDMHQAGWSPAFTGSQSLCEGHGLPSWLYTTDQNSSNAVSVAQCQFFSDIQEADVSEKPQEGLAAVWSMLASRYASNSTVIGADMFNEPNWPKSCSQPDLASFYERIGTAIRDSNPNIMLMYEDNAYSSYNRNGFLLKRQPTLSNAVYSWHWYPTTWGAGEESLKAHFARAQSWGVPFWIGEFDGLGGSYNTHTKRPLDSNWQTDLSTLMHYFKQNGINWSIWEYDGGGYSVVEPSTTQPKQPLLSLLKQDMP